LAAFVGFVGLNYLQFLQQRRTACFDDMAALMGSPHVSTAGVLALARQRAEENVALALRVRRFDSLGPRIQHVTRVLRWFEMAQLFVIFVALVEFPFLDTLTHCWLTSVGLWVLTILAVGSTAYCVRAWLREGEDFQEE